MEGFSGLQACRLTGCSPHQLRYWDEIGLAQPSIQQTGGTPGVKRVYSFRDLVFLKVVKSLLDAGMSLQKVRKAHKYLREKTALDSELLDVRLATDGRSVFALGRDDNEVLDALRQGQLAFFLAIGEITRNLDAGVAQFMRDRDSFVSTLDHVEGRLLSGG